VIAEWRPPRVHGCTCGGSPPCGGTGCDYDSGGYGMAVVYVPPADTETEKERKRRLAAERSRELAPQARTWPAPQAPTLDRRAAVRTMFRRRRAPG